MKPAQLVFIGIAVASGAAAFMLSGNKPAEVPQVVTVVAQPQIETDDVLIASRELALGSVLGDSEIGWQMWPKAAISPTMIRKSDDPRLVQDIKGSVVRGSFLQGEPIRREKLVKGPNTSFLAAILPAGHRAIAINIDTQGSTTAGGFILPNDHVDIIRTFRDDDGPKTGGDNTASETVLRNIRVLAIGQNIQEKNGERVVVGSNATLEVDQHQAEVLVLAQRVGQLSLSLRSMFDTKNSNPVANADDESDSRPMSVVRYGVQSSLGKR